jgi:hypothetical protein
MRAEPDRQHATKVGDLVRTARGRDVLRAHEVHLDLAKFVAALLPPAAMELGDGHPLVLSAQQPYLDYRRSVLAKVDLLLALGKRPDLATAFLWLDTDSAKFGLADDLRGLARPGGRFGGAARFASSLCRSREPLPADPARRSGAVRRRDRR